MQLLTLACPTNRAGQFIAPELADEQTFENLQAFSDRLHDAAQKIGIAGKVQRKRKRLV
jgi:hypothetical protein